MCSVNFMKDDQSCAGEGIPACLSAVTCMGAGKTGKGSQKVVCDDDLQGVTVMDWKHDPEYKCTGTPTHQSHFPLNNTCFKSHAGGYYARAFCSSVDTATAAALTNASALSPFM